MNSIFVFLYKIALQLYGWSLTIIALFHPKARLWVNGRVDVFDKLAAYFKVKNIPVIWFHCASLGEFEQGRSLIEELKIQYPDYKILLTFFSPSGYEMRKHYESADLVAYLPLDTSVNAHKFIEIVQPKLAVFVKYEFWYFYLSTLQKKMIPYFLIAGVFRKNQLFFKNYGKEYLKVIQGFDHLFLQDLASLQIAKQYGIERCSLAGDPRVDRVLRIADNTPEIPMIAHFKGNKKLFILGSTHAKDEAVFFDFLKNYVKIDYFKNWKFLLAPHEVDESHVSKIEKDCPLPFIRYSLSKKSTIIDVPIMVLDTIGQLNAAYQYGDLAYVGGGFNSGIHNILEPAVFGLPILIGPKYHKFVEATELVGLGGTIEVSNSTAFSQFFNKLQNPTYRKEIGTICKKYIATNKGATKFIINYLKKKYLI